MFTVCLVVCSIVYSMGWKHKVRTRVRIACRRDPRDFDGREEPSRSYLTYIYIYIYMYIGATKVLTHVVPMLKTTSE